ncbi:unnamed protein product [Spirodela intermedia]|uniref:Uncharacterized protein n=1 Tax=Spirodela intermedia TaxID=51605 RepID=A0A7I8J343_SPIIN|nr:unnamed protein product [Spirodela intermedia]CAA6663760.1 unnamed protein product [Spirodela intermedia]
MGLGRKNLKRESHGAGGFSLQENQSIMQVVSLRGSNIIEVMDAEGVKSLALFPAQVPEKLVDKASFVVVDGSGRKQALDSGSKVACLVSQVLFHEQVRVLRRSQSEAFRGTAEEDSSSRQQPPAGPDSDEEEDDDQLPPLEANLNHSRPTDLCSDSDSDLG